VYFLPLASYSVPSPPSNKCLIRLYLSTIFGHERVCVSDTKDPSAGETVPLGWGWARTSIFALGPRQRASLSGSNRPRGHERGILHAGNAADNVSEGTIYAPPLFFFCPYFFPLPLLPPWPASACPRAHPYLSEEELFWRALYFPPEKDRKLTLRASGATNETRATSLAQRVGRGGGPRRETQFVRGGKARS